MKIWKYGVSITNPTDIAMPSLAEILFVSGSWGEELFFWAKINPELGYEVRRFSVVGTGHTFESGRYVGSAQVGDFVWHLLEIT